jgi:hypothetical protein
MEVEDYSKQIKDELEQNITKEKGIFPKDLSEHEYFYLAAAAVKIGLVLKLPSKSSSIFKVDVKQLFETALKEGIPFHEVQHHNSKLLFFFFFFF